MEVAIKLVAAKCLNYPTHIRYTEALDGTHI